MFQHDSDLLAAESPAAAVATYQQKSISFEAGALRHIIALVVDDLKFKDIKAHEVYSNIVSYVSLAVERIEKTRKIPITCVMATTTLTKNRSRTAADKLK